MPPNSLRNPHVGLKMKQWKNKRVGARSSTHSTLGVGALEYWDGIKMNSQARIQDEINLHNQENRAVNVN